MRKVAGFSITLLFVLLTTILGAIVFYMGSLSTSKGFNVSVGLGIPLIIGILLTIR